MAKEHEKKEHEHGREKKEHMHSKEKHHEHMMKHHGAGPHKTSHGGKGFLTGPAPMLKG